MITVRANGVPKKLERAVQVILGLVLKENRGQVTLRSVRQIDGPAGRTGWSWMKGQQNSVVLVIQYADAGSTRYEAIVVMSMDAIQDFEDHCEQKAWNRWATQVVCAEQDATVAVFEPGTFWADARIKTLRDLLGANYGHPDLRGGVELVLSETDWGGESSALVASVAWLVRNGHCLPQAAGTSGTPPVSANVGTVDVSVVERLERFVRLRRRSEEVLDQLATLRGEEASVTEAISGVRDTPTRSHLPEDDAVASACRKVQVATQRREDAKAALVAAETALRGARQEEQAARTALMDASEKWLSDQLAPHELRLAEIQRARQPLEEELVELERQLNDPSLQGLQVLLEAMATFSR